MSHGVSTRLELRDTKRKTRLVDSLRHDTKSRVVVLEEWNTSDTSQTPVHCPVDIRNVTEAADRESPESQQWRCGRKQH